MFGEISQLTPNRLRQQRTEPGFPFCLPRMAPLYTRRPPNAPDFVRRTIVRLQRWSPQPAPTWSTSFQGVISDTAPHLYPSSPTLHFRPRVSLPALAAPRSSAACRRTAAGSDVLLPGGASSTGRASRAGTADGSCAAVATVAPNPGARGGIRTGAIERTNASNRITASRAWRIAVPFHVNPP